MKMYKTFLPPPRRSWLYLKLIDLSAIPLRIYYRWLKWWHGPNPLFWRDKHPVGNAPETGIMWDDCRSNEEKALIRARGEGRRWRAAQWAKLPPGLIRLWDGATRGILE